jgi:hypothetical protein
VINRRLDVTRAGSRDADVADIGMVLAALRRAEGPVQIATLADGLGMDGRTVRAAIADLDGTLRDGEWILIAGGDDGVSLARWREDADDMSARLRATADTILTRLRRREEASSHLPLRQPKLL